MAREKKRSFFYGRLLNYVYFTLQATASLLTAENVEMHLSLWKTNGGANQLPGIVVELQRRKGDSIPFHRYSRYILDAAVGDFCPVAHVAKNGTDLDIVYSKKAQRMLHMDIAREPATEQENAIVALEIAHGLLMKDRMDARTLGLESLCLLTDPSKTGYMTAMIASHVVLLGSAQGTVDIADDSNLMLDEAPFQEIREAILSLIQFRRIGEADEFDDGVHSEEEEHFTILHNLALAVLANALNCIENEDCYDDEPEEVRKPRSRTESSTSICESFINDANEITQKEIMKTLIQELGKAESKPHNACLSAKSIGSLCRASEEARKRAKELGAKNVVQTALDVGTRTHLKLKTECEKVTESLTLTLTRTESLPSQTEEEHEH
jgi:hypothetical protein